MRGMIIAIAFVLAASTAAYAQEVKVVGEDIRVPHGDGVQIYVRNKRPEGVQAFKSDRIAILMHGATYPGTAFDLPLAGKSWMDYMAAGASTSTPSTCRATAARRGRRSWMRPPTRMRRSCAPPTPPRRWGRWSTSCSSGAASTRSTCRLVVGHRHHGGLRGRQPGQGRAARAVRAGVAAHHAFPGAGPGQARRLSRGEPRPGARPLADGCARGQEGRPHSRGLVRRVGGRDVRHRSQGRGQDPARAQRRGAGRAGYWGATPPKSLLRPG